MDGGRDLGDVSQLQGVLRVARIGAWQRSRRAGIERHGLVDRLVGWFDTSARDLPWRAPGTSPWAVLVSEFMLQQTPASRVAPVYAAWLARWPTAAHLAAAPLGDAVRAWGKLGYPRRALWLRECAVTVSDRFDGRVPNDVETLLTLPGVGPYTARAVCAFAFGQRQPVVDTNVRRVISRLVHGQAATTPSTARDLAAVDALLPDDSRAARFSAALMELGATLCTSARPACPRCPVADVCAWRAAGFPPKSAPTGRSQRYTGTDRQVRGRLLDVLRASPDPVDAAELDLAWPDLTQRRRALESLIADGLIDPLDDGRFALPA
jgi:A/G-specific adenine glycosylase